MPEMIELAAAEVDPDDIVEELEVRVPNRTPERALFAAGAKVYDMAQAWLFG